MQQPTDQQQRAENNNSQQQKQNNNSTNQQQCNIISRLMSVEAVVGPFNTWVCNGFYSLRRYSVTKRYFERRRTISNSQTRANDFDFHAFAVCSHYLGDIMLWATYLSRGVSHQPQAPCMSEHDSAPALVPDESRVQQVLKYVEELFRQDGASPFSSKMAVGYLQMKLTAHPERMTRVVAYLLGRYTKHSTNQNYDRVHTNHCTSSCVHQAQWQTAPRPTPPTNRMP